MKILLLLVLITIHTSHMFSQVDSTGRKEKFMQDNGIISVLHEKNAGKITFMKGPIPIEQYSQQDFLTTVIIEENSDLNIRVFMKQSLTNYLHELEPDLTAEELRVKGNYQFSFYVDDSLIYTENLHYGAGSKESKDKFTVFRIPLMSSTNEDSWGRFLWQRFVYNGGGDAMEEGTHKLKIEIRPYVKSNELKVGEIIAHGEADITFLRPQVKDEQIRIQYIAKGSGWEISAEDYDKALIEKLNLKIAQNIFKDITSIIVIKNGKLLIEEYFNGASRETLHDTRSVGKSFAGAILGIAIEEGHIQNADQPLSKFYDLKKFKNYSLSKEKVTLKNLLTMSSGFDGNDDNEDSPGYEEKMYPTSDWVKFTLDLPMDSTKTKGKDWQYFTAGVVVLGDIIDKSVPDGLEKYAEKKFFNPLGIKEYQWEYTPQHVANTAGGLRLRSLDLAMFGQLYKNDGLWDGKQVISKHWVNESMTKQINISEGNSYGYLLWNTVFKTQEKKHETFFASGNGGNKVFIFKDEPLVVVITSTAFGKPYGHIQVNKILERYILSAVVK
jgi:CubicO group peptidase (beta-lactamase class C family)